MAEAQRDDNRIPTLIGASSADGTTPVNVWVDPTTHRLLVDIGTGLSSPLTTKGDIWVYTSTDARLPVGADGQVLTADSGEATGLAWSAAGAGDMILGSVQTNTGAKTFNSGTLIFAGATSGTITVNATAVAGTNTLTLPAATDTLVGRATTDTLTNKTINAANNTISLTTDSVDAITEIASAIKSGSDATLVTGTAGTANNVPIWNADGDIVDGGASIADLQQTDEEIQDLVGGMVTGNTETGIAVTYQDADGTLDFVVSDLTVAGDTGSTGMTPGDTLTVAGGTGISTAMSGDTLTITNSSPALSTEEVQDIAGALVATGGTKTGITITYQDSTNDMDFVVDSASDSQAGIVELATVAETDTGTATDRAVTPDGLAGSDFGIRYVAVLCFDYGTDTATGDGKGYFHIPAGFDGMNLVSVHAEVFTAGTTGTTDVQIHNVDNALDMLSTKLTIDSAETGSDTAATAAVINTSNDHVNTNDIIRIDVDAVSTTAAKGLLVTMGFRKP